MVSNVVIKLGCDPELFVRSRKTGEFVSAHDLLPGTKQKPHEVIGGAVQVDGVAAEFNIIPALTANQFSSNIQTVMGELQKFIGPDYELISNPAVTFPEKYFKSLPEDTRILGCNPDFNAWTGQVNETPDGDSTTMRTAAGHVHIGWCDGVDPNDSTHFEDCCIIAKNLDYYLGLYSLQWDQDTQRRRLYGKAGSFRPKSYGIEYRPLSNVWLRTSTHQQWVFNAAYTCLNSLINGGERLDKTFGSIAREFIDNSESWWTKEDSVKSKDHKKISKLSTLTGLRNPPPMPSEMAPKEVSKPMPKKAGFKYDTMKFNGLTNPWAVNPTVLPSDAEE